MKKRMKVLIGYDGSPYADAAIHDLRNAGLATDVDALVISVGETPDLAEATDQADTAVRTLESQFPSWRVRGIAVGGRPATELVQRAHAWGGHLLVVGSQGRSAVGRLIFGSVSLQVAIESPCTVRIGRRAVEEIANEAPRILVGVDGGANGSERTIKHVLNRVWPEGTELRIISVGDGPRTKPSGIFELAQAQGMKVFAEIRRGDPATTLMTEAKEWEAHCVFVGGGGFGGDDDSSNSVSTELAKDAGCSVEIVK